MLIRPAIQQDELDRGYLGRVMRWNRVRDKHETLRLMRIWAGKDPDARPGAYEATNSLLSQIAGLPVEVFVARHTSLPWRRAITPHKVSAEYGGQQSESIVAISGNRLARDAAYCCLACINEDQNRLGYSYWRREHQLPGACTCEAHATPLLRVDDEWAFLKAPAAWIHHAKTSQVVPVGQDALYVERFYAVARMLMARELPVSTAVIRRISSQRGKVRNLQLNGGEVRRPLLSDLVRRTFPAAWLEEVFPPALKSKDGELLNQIDGVFYFAKGASSVEASFLALAVLFDSVQEIEQAITLEEAKPHKSRSRMSPPEDAVLLDAYVRAEGRHSVVAAQCHTSVFVVSRRLLALGLPNLPAGRAASGLLRACQAFYFGDRGVLEAAAEGGVEVAMLETVLRRASPAFAQTLLGFVGHCKTGLAA